APFSHLFFPYPTLFRSFLDRAAIRTDARENIQAYDIQPPNCRMRTAKFSGGNQQKIVLAREIERDPKVLLVGQPTRGVDIGAIETGRASCREKVDVAVG